MTNRPEGIPQWAWEKADINFNWTASSTDEEIVQALRVECARALLSAVEEERVITNDMIDAVIDRAQDFNIALEDWQANSLIFAAIRPRKDQ